MSAPTSQKLTRREREIMDALYGLRWASAEAVREQLVDPPSYSAVRTMLTRLEAKGHVRHREEGLRYVYAPTTSRAAARRSALDRLVRVFFAGSMSEAVTALLQNEEWTADELAAIRREIDHARRKRGPL
ncbi:MAG TPA: BlaI/MecI/CopY family transcriptional regulator [Vicinamibacterales bacterium]